MSKDTIDHLDTDGIDRRGFLKCMAWVGTGVLWSVSSGGIVTSRAFGDDQSPGLTSTDFSFAQISDTHIGFAKEPNKDVIGTFQTAIARLNAMPEHPEFILHTGDLSHLSKPAEFDAVAQIIKRAKAKQAFYCPGEHDFFTDDGKEYLDRFGQGTRGSGWQSFDHRGVHFVGLNNVANLKPGGLGTLGNEQLAWLEKDLQAITDSTPVVVFAHIPLWTVYADWGWGTDDSAEALKLLARFGSVTVLNGHIHQITHKVEGRIAFHTARSTAFPQPAPGTAPGPGPLKVPPEQLHSMLGITDAMFVRGRERIALIDSTLSA